MFWPSKDMAYRYRAFSNDYQERAPFTYVVPFGSKKGTHIECEHATKALFCTMASIFGDEETFCKIKEEADPGKCRKLGRRCQGFGQTVWDEKVNEVAE